MKTYYIYFSNGGFVVLVADRIEISKDNIMFFKNGKQIFGKSRIDIDKVKQYKKEV